MINRQRIILLAGLVVVLGIFVLLGYRFWYQPTYSFYSSDSASVTGLLVRVAAPASGQIDELFFDVGSNVTKGATLATIKVGSSSSIPSSSQSVSTSASSVRRVLTRATSPIGGIVAVRHVGIGDTISTGQPIATIVDPNQLWVEVDVQEARLNEIRVGQPADVSIAAVNRAFHGRVAEIGSATTDVAAPPGAGGVGSADTQKRVPVKVVFDYTGARLVPGMSAAVTINTHAAP